MYSVELDYLKQIGCNTHGDLNYTTQNGIDYYIGSKDSTAIVCAAIKDIEFAHMLYKEDLREMSLTAKWKGIEQVELHTNFGMEIHSKYENCKTVGFDKIVKQPFEAGE
jgi:pyridoxine 5'-phosphate synthase PdxJ